MYNVNNQIPTNECDECLTKGICTANPTLSSVHEIILLYLKELSFYLLKLREFGVTNEEVKGAIVYSLFNIVTGAEYNQDQFHDIISKLDYYIEQSKILYQNFCQKNEVSVQTLKTYFKRNKKFDLTDAIRKGERYFIKKSTTFSVFQKDLLEIILFLIKSVCIKMVELERLSADYDKTYYALLSMLNFMNVDEFSEEKVKEEIKKFIHVYYEIVRDVFDLQIKHYGEIKPVEVSFSITPGKAILVSGSDYRKLEHVLEATKDLDISVYTHGIDMLMTHAFPKINSYPNLKGHFGAGMDSSIIDFASFPGSILMTKGTLQRVEYLYRGRLFTLDPVPPLGVVKIKENNYEPLIKSALDAKGFTHAQQRTSIMVGFDDNEINQKIDEIVDKVIKKEIRHLFIVGLLNYPNVNKQYFDKFFELMPKDCYAISLSYKKQAANVFHVDSYYDYSLIYKILKKINDKVSFRDINASIFMTRCDKHTIANLIYLEEIGFSHIYTCKCPTTLVNPMLMKTLQDLYGIKEFTDPKMDITEMLSEN